MIPTIIKKMSDLYIGILGIKPSIMMSRNIKGERARIGSVSVSLWVGIPKFSYV